ncbi:MAG TPA: GNAT family N-acetyltransferase [Gammaproteobacteria bacterium]
MLVIRDARIDDLPAIEEMVEDFVKGHPAENHPRSADALRRAYFGERPVTHLLVAERDGDIVGMGQWRLGHDMFWGMFFIEAEWLYVRPRCRGSGIVTAIVAAICGHGRRAGAQFLHGGGGERASKLYERVAIGIASRECFLSGKGFQVMAGLEGLPVREIVRRLPTPEMTRQAAES